MRARNPGESWRLRWFGIAIAVFTTINAAQSAVSSPDAGVSAVTRSLDEGAPLSFSDPNYTGSVITTDYHGDPKSAFVQGERVFVSVMALYQAAPEEMEITVSLCDQNGSDLDMINAWTNTPVTGWYNSSLVGESLRTNVPVSGLEQSFDVIVNVTSVGCELTRCTVVLKKEGIRLEPAQDNPWYWPEESINITLVTSHTTDLFYVQILNDSGASAGINWTRQTTSLEGIWEMQFRTPDSWITGAYTIRVRLETIHQLLCWLEFLVTNFPPVAEAGPDQTVDVGSALQFDGSLSTDDGEVVNWTWIFRYDSGVVRLYGNQPSFEFQLEGVYEITLVVSDGAGNLASDSVNVSVTAAVPEMGSSGLLLVCSSLCLAVVIASRRYRGSTKV